MAITQRVEAHAYGHAPRTAFIKVERAKTFKLWTSNLQRLLCS